MSSRKIIYQHFLDGLWTAGDESALRGVAGRLTDEMGFEWFAYLGLVKKGLLFLHLMIGNGGSITSSTNTRTLIQW
jgi:hypothetical protein